MKSTISDSSHRSFIQTVKLDHLVEKRRIRVIFNASHKTVDSFSDHSSSRLGQWHRGKAAANSLRTRVSALDTHHANVHTNGVQAMRFAKTAINPME